MAYPARGCAGCRFPQSGFTVYACALRSFGLSPLQLFFIWQGLCPMESGEPRHSRHCTCSAEAASSGAAALSIATMDLVVSRILPGISDYVGGARRHPAFIVLHLGVCGTEEERLVFGWMLAGAGTLPFSAGGSLLARHAAEKQMEAADRLVTHGSRTCDDLGCDNRVARPHSIPTLHLVIGASCRPLNSASPGQHKLARFGRTGIFELGESDCHPDRSHRRICGGNSSPLAEMALHSPRRVRAA